MPPIERLSTGDGELRNKLAKAIVLLGMCAMLNLSGCATSSSGNYRGANLSEAAKQASGKNTPIPRAEYSHGGLSSQVYREHSFRTSMDVAIDANVAVAASGNGFGFEYSHIRYSSSSLEEGNFYSLYSENVDDDRTAAFGGKLVIGDYTLPATGIVGDSIVSAHSWGLEGFVKYYGPDIAMVTAPYFLVAIGYGDLHWTYRQPITDSSGYTFSTDSLEYMEFKGGVGGELGRYGVLQLSVYAGPVARIYMGRTREGFNNDLFEHRLDMSWGATVGLRF
jgi:hypothetical protein